MVKDYKKTLVLMVEVMAVNYIIFNNFMDNSFIRFIAILLDIFLCAVLKNKVRYNFYCCLRKVGA